MSKKDEAKNTTQDANGTRKRTMFDFILWSNRIELKEVEAWSGVSYATLSVLKEGHAHSFTYRTLRTIANSMEIKVDDFYDWENRTHKYFGDE